MEMEARSEAAADLGGASLESQFAALESSGNVDDELEAMKAQMLGGSSSAGALPAGDAPQASTPQDAAVDAELEALRRQVNEG